MPKVRKKTRPVTKKRTVKRKLARRRASSTASGGGWWWRFPLRLGIYGLVFSLLALLGVILIYGNIARRYDLEELGTMPERSIVYDRKGREIGRLHGANRISVELEEVSPYFVKALLAREDSRFHDHGGVDFIGVARSVVRNVKAQSVREGASTITMQLARNSFDELMLQRSLHRKLVEVMLAKRIEHKYTKDEILTHYVNRIFFGSGIYGIEQASRSYFGKRAAELTLGECAMLSGIIRAPNRFSPFRHYGRAVAERDMVLARMVKLEMVSEQEAQEAKRSKIKVLDRQEVASQESYALDAVRRDLDDLLERDEVEDGGLQIQTHLDADLQALAEAALERGLAAVEKSDGYGHQTLAEYKKIFASSAPERRPKPEYLQGAVVVIDNAGGGILAIVGGRNFEHSKFNRALYASRQVGSVFKPFVYAAAFDNGLMPGTLVDDLLLRRGEIIGHEGSWSPRNSDGQHIGLQPAEVGLIRSRNTMSVRVGNWAGTERLMKMAHFAGFSDTIRPSPQLYIGNLEADLKTLTSAYTIFPGAGKRLPALAIADIINTNGDAFYSTEAVPSLPGDRTGRLSGGVGHAGEGDRFGHRGGCPPARVPCRCWRQDRDDEQLCRCLVHRLHGQDHGRRLGRSGQTAAHRGGGIRRCACIAYLDGRDEGGGEGWLQSGQARVEARNDPRRPLPAQRQICDQGLSPRRARIQGRDPLRHGAAG